MLAECPPSNPGPNLPPLTPPHSHATPLCLSHPQVPLTVLWAGGSAFALVTSITKGHTGPVVAVQQLFYVPLMTMSMVSGQAAGLEGVECSSVGLRHGLVEAHRQDEDPWVRAHTSASRLISPPLYGRSYGHSSPTSIHHLPPPCHSWCRDSPACWQPRWPPSRPTASTATRPRCSASSAAPTRRWRWAGMGLLEPVGMLLEVGNGGLERRK